MASIRVCTATLAALENTSFPADNSVDSLMFPASSAPREGISIPVSSKKLSRRVSFNLVGNRVLELPSNTVMSKISHARSRRHSGFASSLEGADGQSLDDLAKQADRQACALLPHGASPELLDPRCAMTALCVQRGHIRPMNARSLSYSDGCSEEDNDVMALSMPVKGVLKPFTPSPVNAEFLIHGLPESMQDDISEDDEDDTLEHATSEKKSKKSSDSRPKKAAKKKRSRGKSGAVAKGKPRQKQAAGGAVMLPSAVPFPRPIPITTQM
ncbi:hypothetical protein IWW50_003605 [Coemansia erecta]|nr:hypothetical protein GGF43_002148 [Coemansia sp. RSA 2618]KAJ2823850.1 hypothetical protein IWW50_003605 [Coemansia erecta]